MKFISRGSGYSLFLTANEVLLALRKGSPASKFGSEQAIHRLPIDGSRPAGFIAAHAELHSSKTTAAVLRLRLVAAKPRAKITGLEELPGRSNYFIGKDPTNWRTNVPNYAKVKYANVYPGVDLVYHGTSANWNTISLSSPAPTRTGSSWQFNHNPRNLVAILRYGSTAAAT